MSLLASSSCVGIFFSSANNRNGEKRSGDVGVPIRLEIRMRTQNHVVKKTNDIIVEIRSQSSSSGSIYWVIMRVIYCHFTDIYHTRSC